MTTPKLQPREPHEAMLLLPWYAGGALTEGERLMVEAHLRVCADCRAELESIVELRQRVRTMFASAPASSARLQARVLARVRELPRERTLVTSLLAACQRLMRPKWAPAIAASVIAVQAGVLGWLALHDGPQPQVQTRSVDPQTAARIRIVFNPHATERDIRAALTALGGRIVDGPSADGAYLIELPEVTPTVLSQRLRELRARPGLVERIENAAP